jgi:hypothetical protein
MRVLLFSTILYLLGIAVVLYLRPKLMFHPDGRWKEFGLHDDDATVFPFWFFCIGWAVISFLLGRLIVGEPASAGRIVSASLVAAAAPTLTSRVTEPIEPLPVLSSGAETNALSKPGYYKLNANATKRNGVPRYIYVGPELPAEEDE